MTVTADRLEAAASPLAPPPAPAPARGGAPAIPAAIDHPVWLVRHAPTTWTGRRWCGRADPPLSPAGRALAREVAARLAPELPETTIVRSSPARRAQSTASAIARAASLELALCDALVEVDVGRVEGLTWGELSTREPAVVRAIDRGDPIDWPGGESSAEVVSRATRVAARIRADAVTRPVVVVSHGAFLHALVAALSEPAPAAVAAAAPSLVARSAPLHAGGVLRLVPLDSPGAAG
jgi:ribonuclease H / adenosylcobalamin/alpha-ribazole phosphatase